MKLNDTLTSYDLWSRNYDSIPNPMIAMVEWALDHRPSHFEGRRVVELGCGTGRNVDRVLAGGATSYLGVDGSSGMLSIAKQRTPDRRASWCLAELSEPLPLPAGIADLLLVTLVLEHIRDLSPLIMEAARLLAPSGILRTLEIHPDMVEDGVQAHFWHEGREIKRPSFAHSAEEFHKAVATAGLDSFEAVEWEPPAALIEQLPKLNKHRGRPMLLDVTATRL